MRTHRFCRSRAPSGELFVAAGVFRSRELPLTILEYPMTEAQGSKIGNGHGSKEKSTMSAASEKISNAAPEMQDDLQALRDDVAKLTQQLADLAAAKGNE